MGSDVTLVLVLWAAAGVTLGGVVTPLVAANRAFNEWTAMLLGVAVGAVGSIVLLVPLWLLLSRTDQRVIEGPRWQLDAATADELIAGRGAARPARDRDVKVTDVLRENFWPRPRVDDTHSHRQTYVGVFVALAVITAVEVALTYASVPFSITIPLVALSLVKVVLVMMFFMHLRFDSKAYTWMFVLALPFAAMVLTVLALSR